LKGEFGLKFRGNEGRQVGCEEERGEVWRVKVVVPWRQV